MTEITQSLAGSEEHKKSFAPVVTHFKSDRGGERSTHPATLLCNAGIAMTHLPQC